MKKLLLTLIIAFAFSGSIFAQYETHYPGFSYGDFEDQEPLVAAIIIDGNYITCDYETWNALEIAAFVGEEQRSYGFYLNDQFVLDYGDPFPVSWGDAIFFTEPGENLTFKMFDQVKGIEYDFVSAIQDGEAITLQTGVEHTEGWDEWDELDANGVPNNHIIFLSFTTPAATGITKVIEPYTDEGGYYLIASPVGSVTADVVENLLSNTYDLYAFDQTEDLEWRNYKDENFDLVAGTGYLYANSGTDDGESVTLTFPGEAYTGSGEVTLVKDDNAELAGWNLIGNPFNQNVTIERDFYVMNGDGSEIMAAEENVIAPMEGIFVIAESDGETVTFVPEETKGRSANIALNLSNGRAVIDRAIVRFGQDRQLPKFQLKENSTKVYIQQNGKDYAVVSGEAQGEMPVSFKAAKNGTYNLSFNSEVEFSYLHLIDNLTGNDVNLLENPSYSFDANISDYANRFRLVFATGNAADDNFAFYNNGNIIVNCNGNAILNVVDVLGRTISSQNINGSQNVSVNATSGVYTIQLIQGENVKTQKIVVE